MTYGLSQDTIGQIVRTFETYEGVESAILYGSRAMGNYKEGSDIDLTLTGKTLTVIQLNHISNTLDDLLLPYKFDLSLYHYLKNQDILDHIARVGVEFYSKETAV